MSPYNSWSRLALAALLALALAGSARAEKTADPKKPKAAKPPRIHIVNLGGARRVPYTQAGDPAGALPNESELNIRPLVVDGRVKDWTTGEAHDITDRSFTVRRAMRINDALPGDKGEHWVWQRGPWVLVDRTAGHITPLKLPDYNPAVSDLVWFRDYAAYCGLTASGTHLYAVVSQIAVRKPLVAKKLTTWDPTAARTAPACTPATWQREPLRITFQPTGGQTTSFDLTATSTALIEPGDDDDTPTAAPAGTQ